MKFAQFILNFERIHYVKDKTILNTAAKKMENVEVIPKRCPTELLQKDWTKRKCYYEKSGIRLLPKIHDMEVLQDDVWLITLPKCGTTWMQELLWLVLNDFDFEKAKEEHLEVRSPFLEFNYFITEDLETALKPIEDLKSPRLIKSHLPLPLLPEQVWTKKPKLVYVYRNPKDALVSDYYHMRSVGFDMDETCEEYIQKYIDNYVQMRLPFEHVSEFYALRQESWIFYTSFERMKLNLREVISKICTFLNKPITADQMEDMVNHLSFESMKENPKTNHIWEFEQLRNKLKLPYDKINFVRKGKVGGYRDDLSPEFIAKCDKWITDELSTYDLTLNQLLLLENDDK